MTTSYLTIADSAEAETEVRRSRFRCVLRRVVDEDAAREVVTQQRRLHWQARHHCSAMIIGPDRGIERSSDDGEPAGTAGAPMLAALRGREVSDVVAVVTRWFGGVLLGAGGLVRAYGDAVQAALDDAPLIRRELLTELVLRLDHQDAGRIESELRRRGVQVLGTTYAAQATLQLAASPAEVDRTLSLITELTGGTGHADPQGQRWVDVAP